MLVTGTGATGEQAYLIGEGAFEAYGHPVCYVDFPDFTTADIQVSVQYLVYGLRREARSRAARSRSSGSARAGCCPGSRSPTGPICAARSPTCSPRPAPSTAATSARPATRAPRPTRARRPAGSSDGLEPAERPQLATRRDARQRLLHDRALAHRRDGSAAGRQAPDLGARGSLQHPDPGRLPGPHRRPISAPRSTRSPSPPSTTRSSTRARRQGLAPAERRVLAPVRAGARRGDRAALLSAAGGLTSSQSAAAPKLTAEPKVKPYVKRLP